MGKKKLTKKVCNHILADEPSASSLYSSLGYRKQARQEKEHYQFFKGKCKNIK